MRTALLLCFAALSASRSRASASDHSPPQRAAVALPRVAATVAPPAPPPQVPPPPVAAPSRAVPRDPPAASPPAPPLHHGVRGRVMADGQPVAGARVELCEQPLRDLGTGYESPCDPMGREATNHPTYATTGADGRFELVDVPAADVDYWLAVHPPSQRWMYPAGGVNGNDIGDTPVDLGDVTVRLRR